LSLPAEVAVLDGARRALADGDPGRALSELSRYDRDFPNGMLSQEATLIRIEALVSKGDRARARALADRYLAAHPNSSHAARVRSLLGDKP
jgi:outer membrane protein assembly factor BamD (BamD/ComL family)